MVGGPYDPPGHRHNILIQNIRVVCDVARCIYSYVVSRLAKCVIVCVCVGRAVVCVFVWYLLHHIERI